MVDGTIFFDIEKDARMRWSEKNQQLFNEMIKK
jgi:hypothetical protein